LKVCFDKIVMSKIEEIKIFLASPSDVPTERRHVGKVIDELNRTVAADKGVHFVVTRSENAFPGYGKDGQAILNEQIGIMQNYDLFVGIMWSRIGTPTPRSQSGTVEEFGRAVQSWRRKRKPQVWFYFRLSPVSPKTRAEIKQLDDVMVFRNKFRGKGLFREYTSPADFRDQLRVNLTLWLNDRQRKAPKSRSTSSKQNTTPRVKAKSESPPVVALKKTATVATAKAATSKKTTATKPSTTSRKISSKSGANRSTGALKSPKDWVMLDGKFFQAKSSCTQPDQSILLQISPKDLEQSAELKALYPGEFHNRKLISFADSHEAEIVQVSSVTTESVAGKSSFSITLNPNQRSQNRSFGMEVNYQNYNADKVAELRARLILLGEPLPKEIGHFVSTQITGSHNQTMTIKNGIFPDLWAKLQAQPTKFLPKAWLWAAYCLKTSQIIEDVLELELGSIKNKVMSVRFRGKRKKFYSSQEPSIISVVGSCNLSV
jgi:hypothetical protein